LFEFLKRKQPAIDEMSQDAFTREHGPSMIFTARLQMLPEFPDELSSVSYVHAGIDELGFGRSWSGPFALQAPRGAVRPRGRGSQGRCLTLAQREEIALGRAGGQSVRSIPAGIGYAPSTV
jgi:Helix-turn-helix domain